MIDPSDLDAIAKAQPPFPLHIGARITSATLDRVEGEMVVTPELGNRNGVLHGGAIMAFADNLAGTASFLNLKPGQSTTMVESKTNFFRAVPIGEVLHGICEPLHRGRRTMVWQSTLTRADGKVAALVIQTQMTLEGDGR